MVTIQQATEKAMEFALAALGPERTKGLRLEEVDSQPDAWLITLSMVSDVALNPIAAALGKREYKIFKVLKQDGEVKSMKIRELADA